MARHHYLPATYLASFSADEVTRSARNRRLFVGDRLHRKFFESATHNVGAISNLYVLTEEPSQPYLLEQLWSKYETNLSDAVSSLISGQVDAISWIRILVPFVAGMLVRGPDFNYRFKRRLQSLGLERADIHWSADNTNRARILELQRLLGPVAAAHWTVVKIQGEELLITNDLGYAVFLNPLTQESGMAIPLDTEHVLSITPRRKGVVATVNQGQWVPAIDYAANEIDNHQGLNRAIAESAQRFIFGPERKLIKQYLRGLTRTPQPLEPLQLGFITGREMRAHEFTWHRLVSLLERNPNNEAAKDLELDWELISKGWCPPIVFPTNLPIFPTALKRIKDTVEVDFYDPSVHYEIALVHDLERFGESEQLVTRAEQAVGIAEEEEQLITLYLALGAGLDELGRLEDAIAAYDKILEINPDFAPAHCNKGVALYRIKHLEEAMKSLTRAVELDPTLGEAWLNRGTVAAELEQHSQSEQDFLTAILKLPPGHHRSLAYMCHGNSLIILDRYEEAISDYGEGLKHATSSSDKALLFARRAIAHRLSGDHQSAIGDIEQAILLAPNFDLAQEVKAWLDAELRAMRE